MDGILAADLAAEGYQGALNLFELEKGWLDAFIQDRDVEVPPLDFDDRSELLRNGYKLFTGCRATHASSQTAMSLHKRIAGQKVESVLAHVHPGALVTAGKLSPKTALEAKFSVPFCIAMALNGYKLAAGDFTDRIFDDENVISLVPRIRIQPVEGQSPASALLTVTLENGTSIKGKTDVILGHPENPVSDRGLEEKYLDLVEPILGSHKARSLLEAAWNFGASGTLQTISQALELNDRA